MIWETRAMDLFESEQNINYNLPYKIVVKKMRVKLRSYNNYKTYALNDYFVKSMDESLDFLMLF